MLPKRVLWYGTDNSLPERVQLAAGPLAVTFEQGMLRYIRLGDREVLRAVYIATRDANWGAVPNVISNLHIDRGPRSFRIRFDVVNRKNEIHFAWSAIIAGDERGTITFSFDGKALSTFRKNRIGFCVLHPIRECAGRPCTVEKAGGGTERGVFPRYVSPHQPFLDMRSISHEVLPACNVEVRFSGDVFEMEDQRNWTDASYKTYCTPLRLPFPVEVQSGTEIRQSVRLSLSGSVPDQPSADRTGPVTFSVDPERTSPLPAIGLGIASHGRRTSDKEVARLKALRPAHLRVDLDLRSDYSNALQHAATQSAALGAPLEVAIIASKAAEEEIGQLLTRARKARIARWLVFQAEAQSAVEKWLATARKQHPAYDGFAGIVAGTNANFAELNRSRPDLADLDGVCFPVNPQVHAFDNDTLVENLAAQCDVLESARQFAGRSPVYVTPVTLKPRFNPVATGPEPPPGAGELPSQVDPRQMSLFGAGWTAGSLKYISQGGAAAVTYYETTGWRGVMETVEGSQRHELFRSIPGAVFPLYHVLADAAEFAGGTTLRSESSAPLAADGLALRKNGRTRILVASYRPEPIELRISAAALGRRARMKQLDAANVEAAMTAPERFREDGGRLLDVKGDWIELTLRPYAIVRFDSI